MSVRQCLKARADVLELIDFAQDRLKRHGYTALAEKPKVGELQMDWLRSEDLKEEKVVTAPVVIIAVRRKVRVIQIDCKMARTRGIIDIWVKEETSDTRRGHQGNGKAESG